MAEAIILTHCHADHDAGVFQKIREEAEVTIYTTQTIMQSFVRKYSAIANVSPAELMSLFRFTPVPMDAPLQNAGLVVHERARTSADKHQTSTKYPRPSVKGARPDHGRRSDGLRSCMNGLATYHFRLLPPSTAWAANSFSDTARALGYRATLRFLTVMIQSALSRRRLKSLMLILRRYRLVRFVHAFQKQRATA